MRQSDWGPGLRALREEKLNRSQQQRVKKKPSGGKVLKYLLLLVVASGAAYGVMYYLDHTTDVHESELPWIKAEETPIKVRPRDPVTNKIPHQDKTVYNQIAPTQSKVQEKLLALPEEPHVEEMPTLIEEQEAVDDIESLFEEEGAEDVVLSLEEKLESGYFVSPMMPKVDSSQSSKTPNVSEEHVVSQEEAVVAKASSPKEQEKVLPPLDEDSQEVIVADKPSNLRVSSKHIQVKPQSQKKQSQKNADYRIQVASMRSMQMAEKEWQRLRRHTHLNPFLSKVQYKIERVDLGRDHGVVFRVHAGPLNKENAMKICRKIRAVNGGCMVVRS